MLMWQILKRIFIKQRSSKALVVTRADSVASAGPVVGAGKLPTVMEGARSRVSGPDSVPERSTPRVKPRDRHQGHPVKLRLRQWEFEALLQLADRRGLGKLVNKLASQIVVCRVGYGCVPAVFEHAAESLIADDRTRLFQLRVDPELLHEDDEVPLEVSPLGDVTARNGESVAHLLTRFLRLRVRGEIRFVSGYVAADRRAEIQARYGGRVEFLD